MAAIDADLQAAFEYTFPLYEMARTRYFTVELPANPNRGANRIGHRRTLSDHTSRNVTTPNNDTLYSSAWLDLSAGPVEITVPKISKRYWSFHFMDAYTSTAELIGSRNAGEGDLKLWVVRDGDTGPVPAGVRVVRLPTRDVWMLVRILVDNPEDALLVHKLQDAIQLRVVNDSAAALTNPLAPKLKIGSPTDGANYLDVVNSMLARNPVPDARNILAGWQKTGVLPGSTATDASAKVWTDALPELNKSIRDGVSMGARWVQRWQYPPDDVGLFGHNYTLRAAVALGGLGALPAVEAVYLSAITDQQDQPLTGLARYRVKIPARGIPTNAFWSLSMYQIEADGRLFFVDNALKRYTVGDRTPGILKNADGSLDIVVQNIEPAEARDKANWLPTPSGPFRMMLRAYLPSDDLREGKAALPTVERAP